ENLRGGAGIQPLARAEPQDHPAALELFAGEGCRMQGGACLQVFGHVQAARLSYFIPMTKLATFETNRGTIVAELYDKDAPNTVANFEKLANSKFYDGVKFHRVIADFVVQGGDPLSRDLPEGNPRIGTG